jgi:hypothetical protein
MADFEADSRPLHDGESDDDFAGAVPAASAAAVNLNNRDLPTVATPEEDERDIAAAAAEVSVMGQGARGNSRNPTGDAAFIGATGNAEGVGSFEMVDEVAELVKERFLQFLMEL